MKVAIGLLAAWNVVFAFFALAALDALSDAQVRHMRASVRLYAEIVENRAAINSLSAAGIGYPQGPGGAYSPPNVYPSRSSHFAHPQWIAEQPGAQRPR